MAVYHLTKNRLISKAANFRPIPKQWTPKWTIAKRSFANQQQQFPGDSQKGKLHKFKRKWSWKGAGGAGLTILTVLDWWLLAAGGWLTWRGVFMRWTPLGLCLMAAAQWRSHGMELERQGLPRTATQWQMHIYCSLPLRLMSKAWGWLADCHMPEPMRPLVYGMYSKSFGVNMAEAECPDLRNYKSIGEFFTRSLREDARFIDPLSCIVSPCDGRVLHFGPAGNANIEQVKGVSYSLEAFLGPQWQSLEQLPYVESIKQKPESTLYQCIIYLAPGDYHRFHSPTAWKPEIRRHFHGELLSVSPKIAKWVPGLFALNERAVYIGKWQHGFFSFTAVGATNVGSVQIFIDEELKTNRWRGLKVGQPRNNDFDEIKLPEKTALEKGELVGQFNMGSTIVLIFEAPKDFKFSVEPGDQVRVGQRLGCETSSEPTSSDEEIARGI